MEQGNDGRESCAAANAMERGVHGGCVDMPKEEPKERNPAFASH